MSQATALILLGVLFAFYALIGVIIWWTAKKGRASSGGQGGVPVIGGEGDPARKRDGASWFGFFGDGGSGGVDGGGAGGGDGGGGG